MIVCRVIGHVWATKKDARLEGLKLMVVREEDPVKSKNIYVAADIAGAGIGEKVIVVSGSTARKTFGRDDIPVDMAIVAIIDNIEMDMSAK